MTNTPDWQYIAKQIEQTTEQPFTVINSRPVGGGCINTAYILQGQNSSYFIKLNRHELLSMFEAEFAGLQEIAQTKTVPVPQAIIYGISGDKAFLVLNNIQLATSNTQSDKQLGQQLAELHKIQQPYFGWHQNNTIGSTEQINQRSDDWISFWRKQRLSFQLSLAEKNGYGGKLTQSGEKLSESLDYFFDHYKPQPSLLHGDLWSGNYAATNKGDAIIYDPACYYGDRETDIAMTELFGGFGSSFINTYNNAYPLHSDYSIRKTLYNLYHILNHLNLFGSSYQHQAQCMIDSLLSEIA
ncbi:MAG: fructosamine kinase family protein [Methylococcaceae bacterium]